MSTRQPATQRPNRILAYIDLILAALGLGGTAVAITVLASWPWALLTVSIALIALALVVPSWD